MYSSLDPLHEHVKAALHYLQIVSQKRYIHTYYKEKLVNVNKEEDGTFFITSDDETSVKAKKAVLEVGYHDYIQTSPVCRMLFRYDYSLSFFVMVTNRDSVWVLWWIPMWNLSGYRRWHKNEPPILKLRISKHRYKILIWVYIILVIIVTSAAVFFQNTTPR